ncbi:MAG: vanadium-dependent haloperoxidase [Actinomycetota bacterium]
MSLAQRIRTRRTEARELREEAAQLAFLRPHPDHLSNGEELEYRRPSPPAGNGGLSYIANHSKSLPHNRFGEVNQRAYRALLRALHSGNPDHFQEIPLGRGIRSVRLINPQAGFAFDLEGPDAQAVTVPPAPRIDGAENSAEMGELYWMALLHDVSFIDYGTGANTDAGPINTAAAADSLSTEFSVFKGPKVGTPPVVTPATLFRGFARGDLEGPYLSQFLLKGTADPVLNPPPDNGIIGYGTLGIDQKQRTVVSGLDYLTAFADWLAVQDGEDRRGTDTFDPTPRFIRNLRDLGSYVHYDALYEAYLNACLLLLRMPARLDPGNPYVDPVRGHGRTQDGFGTFGGPHILSLVTEVATRALKAVWYQKWSVHRRLRPEEFGGRIQVHRTEDPGRYPMIDNEILNSSVVPIVENQFGSALLPQAFPEGSPTHPAYGAGHATVAGACVTILKAWFDESDAFDPALAPATNPLLQENRRPKVPDAAGTALVDFTGPGLLTVGGELNKLAANIAIGRNGAGVHWRSDYTESVKLGEQIAIGILQEQKATYLEDHHLSLTKFDGTAIII